MADENVAVPGLGGRAGCRDYGAVKAEFLGLFGMSAAQDGIMDDAPLDCSGPREIGDKAFLKALRLAVYTGYAGRLLGDEDTNHWMRYAFTQVFNPYLAGRKEVRGRMADLLIGLPEWFIDEKRRYCQLPSYSL